MMPHISISAQPITHAPNYHWFGYYLDFAPVRGILNGRSKLIEPLWTLGSKAAYWDGRSEAGEQVSSGVYFYHFRAGDYSETQEMTVVK